MQKHNLHRQSDLFTLRIWVEALEDNQREWRGQVEHVISGDTQYFRHWSTLIAFLKKSRSGSSDPEGRGITVKGLEGKEQEA